MENSNFVTPDTFNEDDPLSLSYLVFGLVECDSVDNKTCDNFLSEDMIKIQRGEQLVYSVRTKTSGKKYYALGIYFPNEDAPQSQTGTDGNPLTFSGYVTIDSTEEVYVGPFTRDSWATIAANIQSGNASMYKVGEEKEVTIDGVNYTVRIANNSNYDCTLDSKTACGFVVEFVDIVEQRAMNDSDTNVGGWPASAMRTYLNETFKSKLPSDLQSVIIDTPVVSGYGYSDSTNFPSLDKLYLLSTGEIYSDCTTENCDDTASYPYNGNGAVTTRQLDYYANKGVSTSSNYIKVIKKYNGTAAWWWLRAANSTDDIYFSCVDEIGNSNISTAYTTDGGITPAFRIG